MQMKPRSALLTVGLIAILVAAGCTILPVGASPAPVPTVQKTAMESTVVAPESADAAVAAAAPAGEEAADSVAAAPAEPMKKETNPDPLADYLANCPICTPLDGYSGVLSPEEIQGLQLSLNDEYHAAAVYSRILDDFGQIRPFSNILRAEFNHAASLERTYTAYGIPIPENPWMGAVEGFESVSAACSVGVEAEILNRDLYAILFASTDREDILRVYRALQSASEENHLPAFQRCAG